MTYKGHHREHVINARKNLRKKSEKDGYYYKIVTQNGVKGVCGVYQGNVISFTPIDDFRSQKIRMKIRNAPIGKIVKPNFISEDTYDNYPKPGHRY